MKYIISEQQINKFKEDKWCRHIREIVSGMNIKKLCGVQVKALDNTFGDDETFRTYLVILQLNGHRNEIEKVVSNYINGFLPHLDLAVISLPCETEVNI